MGTLSGIVSIASTHEFSQLAIDKAVIHVLESSDFKPSTPDNIVIKVNLRYYWDASTGETTDPRVVSALIDYLRHHFGKTVDITIAEADASAMRTKYAFKMLGYEQLARDKHVRLMNLSQGDRVTKEVLVNNRSYRLPVAQQLLDTDLLINVPKLRTHRLVTISCGLKNLFGAIARPRKVAYHSHLNEIIVAINKILHPQLTLIDGIIALGRHPVKLGVVLASTDRFAIDYVAAKVMGYNPRGIKHLQLAEKEGLGDSARLTIIGNNDLSVYSNKFPRENYTIYNLKWELQLAVLNLYLKLTDDTRPPVLDS